MNCVASYWLDITGKVVIAEITNFVNLTTTKKAFKKSMGDDQDGYFAIIDHGLSHLEYSTYIGGGMSDQVHSVLAQDTNTIILAGITSSALFVTTPGA